MLKSRLISLLLSLALSGIVYAQQNTTYSVLDKPVASAVRDNEMVVEFFLSIVLPVMLFPRYMALIKLFAKAFHREKTR